MLNELIKSVLEVDRASIVICNLSHEIVYMNPAAIQRYHKRGGADLIGKNLFNCHNEESQKIITRIIGWFGESTENNIIFTFRDEKENKDVYMVALRDEKKKLIGYYEKHEYRNLESARPYDFSKSL